MATNAYLERMNELQAQRVSSNRKELSESTGVPIHRPTAPQQEGSPSGVPTGEAPIPQEDDSYKDTHFFSAVNHYTQNDKRFGGVMDEITKLATGLREQVNQGYMPPQIARQRLTQFVGDTMSHFERQAPKFAEEDKQEKMQQLLGAFSGQAQQQQQQGLQDQVNAPTPAEGISQQQAMQQQDAAQQLQGGNQ